MMKIKLSGVSKYNLLLAATALIVTIVILLFTGDSEDERFLSALILTFVLGFTGMFILLNCISGNFRIGEDE